VGGYGVISVASHLVGNQIRTMMDKFLCGKVAEAAAIHRGLLPLLNALFIVANPIPIKHALNFMGFPVGRPRLPLVEPDEKTRATIETTLKSYSTDLLPAYLKKA
ncbi:MAG: dihydrodipicolinate synthase family protein, partial [Chloroflexi bacterium]|nr:dihydrodipicolinate synthase family protein [Chloroflexota bacterium]